MKLEVLAQPFGARVGDRLIRELASGRWERFRCAVAYAKLSGVRYLDGPLRAFVAGGGEAEIGIGIDSGGTSFEAASQLAGAVDEGGRLLIATEIRSYGPTFHPKLYAFTVAGPPEQAMVIVGSSNITEGGLFTNHELSTAFGLDAADADDAELLSTFESQLDEWHDLTSGLAVAADRSRLLALYDEGRLPKEAGIAASRKASSPAPHPGGGTKGLSKRRRKAPKPRHAKTMGAPLAPPPSRPPTGVELPPPPPAVPPIPPAGSTHNAFYIDIATGTSKTEIYLSKVALTEDPGFFRHPFHGETTPKLAGGEPQPELDPRPIVDIRLLDSAGAPVAEHTYPDHPLKVWEYANGKNAKHELRITIPAALLHSLPEDCILEMRRHPVRAGIDYRLDFLTPGSRAWRNARARASRPLRNSRRKVGWS